MKTPFDYLCGLQCVVGDRRCPAFDVCPVNRDLTKTILLRYYNCCRRGLKYNNIVCIEYTQIENLVRSSLSNGFQCPVCGVTMAVNNGQTEIDTPVYSIEHVKPLAKGGENTMENITICCRKCNMDNNNADMLEELYE
jgi:5-methylcytosine-specific restriction endonuclease McrA